MHYFCRTIERPIEMTTILKCLAFTYNVVKDLQAKVLLRSIMTRYTSWKVQQRRQQREEEVLVMMTLTSIMTMTSISTSQDGFTPPLDHHSSPLQLVLGFSHLIVLTIQCPPCMYLYIILFSVYFKMFYIYNNTEP